MAENALVTLRKNKEGFKANALQALRTRSPNVIAREKEAEGGQRPPDADPYEIERARILAEFNKLPWYEQAGTAADDLLRLGVKGASFGGADILAGGEHPQLTREASMRAGMAGNVAEIGGMLASPVTRAVGAGAQAIRPAADTLLKALASLGVTAGEGAALSGIESVINDRENLAEDAALGAGLSSGAETIFKHIVPKGGKALAAWLSGVPTSAQSDIFEMANRSPLLSKALKEVQGDLPPSTLQDSIVNQRKILESVDVPDPSRIEEALAKVIDDTKTTGGFSALDSIDTANVEKLISQAYDPKTGAFNRKTLADLAAYLENTKVSKAASKSESGRHVGDVHKVVKEVGGEVDPRFTTLMQSMDDLKKVFTSGKATSTWRPQKTGPGAYISLASLASLPFPAMLGLSPMLTTAAALATPGALAASSPKLVGKTARLSGAAKRRIKKAGKRLTGSEPTYGKLGLTEPAVEALRER